MEIAGQKISGKVDQQRCTFLVSSFLGYYNIQVNHQFIIINTTALFGPGLLQKFYLSSLFNIKPHVNDKTNVYQSQLLALILVDECHKRDSNYSYCFSEYSKSLNID